MVRFTIEIAPAAVKDLNRLESEAAEEILQKISILEQVPFPKGKLIKKIKGKKSVFYRLRVDKMRVFYEIMPGRVVIMRILSKKETDKYIKRKE
jgi:mRNA interferase RelE/StbE